MEGEQQTDPARAAARDVARLFNRPGLRQLTLLARRAEGRRVRLERSPRMPGSLSTG